MQEQMQIDADADVDADADADRDPDLDADSSSDNHLKMVNGPLPFPDAHLSAVSECAHSTISTAISRKRRRSGTLNVEF